MGYCECSNERANVRNKSFECTDVKLCPVGMTSGLTNTSFPDSFEDNTHLNAKNHTLYSAKRYREIFLRLRIHGSSRIMKKVQTKRGGFGFAKPKDLLKPFNFCCDVAHQDQDTRYNTRIPPLVTSLTNIAPKTAEGPDLKFRLHDVGKPTVTTFKSGIHKVKSHAAIGHRGKMRGRGPLRWYIEDEIALARDIIANEKVEKRKRAEKHRRDLSKAKKKRRRSKNRKSHEVADDNRGNDEDPKDVDKEG